MKIRIAKFIADTGTSSRREAEKLIESGAVVVNGEKITTPVFFVDDNDKISVNGKILTKRKECLLYAFHKPINVMTTSKDPDGRTTIYDILPKDFKQLKYVGRLDYKTTGLLLLTNDGNLIKKLTLPSSKIPRTYIATVEKLNKNGLEKAKRGITISGISYRPMKIEILHDNVLKIEVTEGKKNEIRIVLRHCGCPVTKLHRISFGEIKLGNLSVGKIRKISQKTIDALIKSL